MMEEKNTGTNLPAQIDIYAEKGNAYEFLFITKGGGSGNKTYLYQQTKSLLTDENLTKFVKEKIMDLGTNFGLSSIPFGACHWWNFCRSHLGNG